jgi:hypothetical protein
MKDNDLGFHNINVERIGEICRKLQKKGIFTKTDVKEIME